MVKNQKHFSAANYSQTRTNPKTCLQQNNYNEVKKLNYVFNFHNNKVFYREFISVILLILRREQLASRDDCVAINGIN